MFCVKKWVSIRGIKSALFSADAIAASNLRPVGQVGYRAVPPLPFGLETHFCSKVVCCGIWEVHIYFSMRCIMGYGTDALWDLWDWPFAHWFSSFFFQAVVMDHRSGLGRTEKSPVPGVVLIRVPECTGCTGAVHLLTCKGKFIYLPDNKVCGSMWRDRPEVGHTLVHEPCYV